MIETSDQIGIDFNRIQIGIESSQSDEIIDSEPLDSDLDYCEVSVCQPCLILWHPLMNQNKKK